MPAIGSSAIKGSAKFLAQLASLAGIDKVEALTAGANAVLPYMQSITPVDTGELRDSEKVEVEGENVNLVAEAEHASHVEFGTIKMRARPFMRTTIDTQRGTAGRAVAANVKRQFKRKIGF